METGPVTEDREGADSSVLIILYHYQVRNVFNRDGIARHPLKEIG
jgi:hypothetical protein